MNKKKVTIIASMVILVIICAVLSFAMYTSQSSKKAVIATSRIEVPFSSNFMKLVSYSTSPKFEPISPVLSPGKGDTMISFVVTVNNFPANKISQTAKKYISYDARFNIIGGSGNYTIRKNGGAAKSVNAAGLITFNSTLKTGRQTDSYEITMPVADLGIAKIEASATPDEESLETVSRKMLVSELHPRLTVSTVSFECVGEFTDSKSGKPYDFDAFKYHFYITKGSADVTLRWDSRKVTIDPAFKSLVNGKSATDGNKDTLTFKMDYDVRSGYDVIFYRVAAPGNDTWQSSWENMADVINVNAKENK